jgi:hypothetical protein
MYNSNKRYFRRPSVENCKKKASFNTHTHTHTHTYFNSTFRLFPSETSPTVWAGNSAHRQVYILVQKAGRAQRPWRTGLNCILTFMYTSSLQLQDRRVVLQTAGITTQSHASRNFATRILYRVGQKSLDTSIWDSNAFFQATYGPPCSSQIGRPDVSESGQGGL